MTDKSAAKKNRQMKNKNPIQAYLLRLANPGYSTCARCRYPWRHVYGKTVKVDESTGVFATCDECWELSSEEELKGYFQEVYKGWLKDDRSQKDIGFTLEELLSKVKK